MNAQVNPNHNDNFIKNIMGLRDYYGKYHDHKENMAWLAIGSFATVSFMLSGNNSPLLIICNKFISFSCFIILLIIGSIYIYWQLERRMTADIFVKAANNTICKFIREEINNYNECAEFEGFSLSRPLIDEFNNIKNHNRLWFLRLPIILIILALLFWALLMAFKFNLILK